MASAMPIFCPYKSQPKKYAILSAAKDLLIACCATVLLALPLPAQTLAHPGWAGSGIGSEAWWRSAVFYRIDVKHFQDSDGDGVGDLHGISQRLDYLQSLGIDAIVITAAPDDPGFDDLLRDASARHIRIVVALDKPAPPAEVLGLARLWLTRGAAGIDIDSPLLAANPAAPLHELRALTDSFPGERVLLANPGSAETALTQPAQLVSVPVDFPMSALATPVPPDLQLRSTGFPSPPPGTTPLFASESHGRTADAIADPARSIGVQKTIATRLLTARGAVLVLYGQELGIVDTPPATPPGTMQWTPTNITPPKREAEPEEPPNPAAPPPPENVYGAFKPYVPPKPKPKPLAPGEVPRIDPNTLPGFTSGALTGPLSANHATVNVAVEDTDPNSLLNFYRRLIQLHHDNPSLRSGTTYVLDHDAEKALVSIRRAPAGSRTAASVVIACNLSGTTLTLSLDMDFAKLQMHGGSLRPLAASWTAIPLSQSSNHIVLPPYSAYVAELYH